jgi:hypothetical protein
MKRGIQLAILVTFLIFIVVGSASAVSQPTANQSGDENNTITSIYDAQSQETGQLNGDKKVSNISTTGTQTNSQPAVSGEPKIESISLEDDSRWVCDGEPSFTIFGFCTTNLKYNLRYDIGYEVSEKSNFGGISVDITNTERPSDRKSGDWPVLSTGSSEASGTLSESYTVDGYCPSVSVECASVLTTDDTALFRFEFTVTDESGRVTDTTTRYGFAGAGRDGFGPVDVEVPAISNEVNAERKDKFCVERGFLGTCFQYSYRDMAINIETSWSGVERTDRIEYVEVTYTDRDGTERKSTYDITDASTVLDEYVEQSCCKRDYTISVEFITESGERAVILNNGQITREITTSITASDCASIFGFGFPCQQNPPEPADVNFFGKQDAGFSYTPTNPAAEFAVTFRSAATTGGDIQSFQWAFGDGTTASGSEVSHTYDAPGKYEVTHTVTTAAGEEFTRSREINVEKRNTYRITSVTPYINDRKQDDLSVVESVNFDLSYHVRVNKTDKTDKITLTTGGQTYSGEQNGQVWVFDIDPTTLEPGARVQITATSDTGQTDVVTRPVEVINLPDWLEGLSQTVLGDEAKVEFETTLGIPPDDSGLSLVIPDRFNFGGIEIPLAGQSQDPKSSVSIIVTIDLATLSTDVTISGNAKYSLTSKLTVSGSLSGSGYLDLEKGELTRATAEGDIGTTIEYPPPPIGIPSPPIGPVPPGIVRLFPIFDIRLGADAEFTTTNGDGAVPLEFQRGSIEPELTAKQELGQKWNGNEVIFGLKENFAADIPVPSITPVTGSIGAEAYIRVSLLGQTLRKAFPPGQDLLSYDFSLGGGAAASRTFATEWQDTGGTGWQLQQRTGATPPKSSGLTASGTVSTADVTGSGFITNDSVADTNPALTRIDGNHLAVWSRQDPNKSVLNGRDIYLSQRANGTFGGFKPVTNDSTRDFDPALAGPTRDQQVIVFATLNRTVNRSNVSNPMELFPNTEIALTTATDGDNWTESQLLTNESTDYRHYAPTIAHSNGTWLIAWQESTDANNTTLADQRVKYLWYDGNTSNKTSVSAARAPMVAQTEDGNLQLAYLDMRNNRTMGNVTVKTFNPTERTLQATHQYGVTEFSDIALDNGSLAWTDKAANASVRFVPEAGETPTSVPVDVSGTPQSIALTTSNGTELLNVRGFGANSTVSQVSYVARVAGEWLPPQTYANGSAQNLTYWQGASAPARNGFVSVFAGKDLGTEQKYDLYTFDQEFRPDLTIVANTSMDRSNLSTGDNITIEYEIKNTGVQNTSRSYVGLRAEGSLLSIKNRSGLAPGETHTGSFNTTVPSSGRLTVVADPRLEVPDQNRRNNSVTLRIAKTAVVVDGIGVSRDSGTKQFRVTVRNPLNVTVPAFEYTIEAGPGLQTSGMLPSLGPGQTTDISLSVPTSEIDPQYALRVELTPAGMSGDNQTVTFSTPLRPKLSIESNQIGYYERDNQTVAVPVIGNAGLTRATVVINITNQTTGELLRTRGAVINASDGTNDTTFTRVAIPLPEADENETIQIELSRSMKAERVAGVVVDKIALGTALVQPQVDIELNRTSAAVGRPIEISAVNVSSPIGEVTELNWQLNETQTPTNRSKVVFTPQEVGRAQVSVVAVNGQGVPRRTVESFPVKLPAVSAASPKNLDGDQYYEDVTGTNGLNIIDVQVLFDNLDDPAVQNNPGAYNFQGDEPDEVGVLDIQALYDKDLNG